MDFLPLVLILATLLCSLVAGFLLAFAVVVMPGLKTLDDRSFLRAFQVIDDVIQTNQPVFMFAWIGSVVFLVIAALLGLMGEGGAEQTLLLAAAAIYVLGVQVPTALVNVPLNNQLQAQDIRRLRREECADVRLEFEARWNRWNVLRTMLSCGTSALLLVVLWTL